MNSIKSITSVPSRHINCFVMLGYFFKCLVFIECYFFAVEAIDPPTSNGWDDAFSKDGSILPLYTFGSGKYYLGNIFKATYLQADQFCKDIHMDLVSVESKEENAFLYDLVQKNGKEDHFWTSGTRLIDGKNFIWASTAKTFEYTNWLQGQPDNINEKCAELWLVRNKDLYWNDRDCNAEFYFVCEKQDNKNEPNGNKNWPAVFEDPNVSPNVNLLHYKDKSYYFNNYLHATFLQAVQFCQVIDMELVTIESDEVNTRLYKYIRDTLVGDSFWSSGTRLIDDKNWYWLSNGNRVDYTNWQSGQPDYKEEKCIQLIQQRDKGLIWNNLGCQSQLYFICQSPTEKYIRPTNPGTDTSIQPVSTTPKPTFQEQYYIGTQKLTHSESIQACKNLSMQLVSIQSEEKNNEINKLIQKISGVDHYWTSGNRLADHKTWEWLDGKKIEYFNWGQGEPNDYKQIEFCLELFKVNTETKWNDLPCDYKNFYVCEVVQKPGCEDCCSVVNVYVNSPSAPDTGTTAKPGPRARQHSGRKKHSEHH